MDLILTFLAILPLILVFVLMAVFRQPSNRALPISWMVTVFAALFFWKINPADLAVFSFKGMFIAIDILFINPYIVAILQLDDYCIFIKKLWPWH